jgi:hypothetical protein
MPSRLSFVSLSIGALLMLSIATVTTTSAYAQPNNNNNIPKNCPPNTFSFEKGYCIYEATPAPLTCADGLEMITSDPQNVYCRSEEPTRYHPALCPSGSSYGMYTHPDLGFIGSCILDGGRPPNDVVDPSCDMLYVGENEVVELENYEAPNFRHETICAFYQTAEPTPQGDPTCPSGGELSNGNCRVKLGNNRA